MGRVEMSKDFNEMIDDSNNLLCIDSLNMAFRWRKQVSGWSDSLVKTIISLQGSYNCVDVLVLGDGGSTYRKALYADYKGNRKNDDQTEEDKNEWKEFFDEYERAMAKVAEVFDILKFKGIEADDIAAYISKILVDSYDHIWMISSDRDWDLLVNEKVSRFSLFSKKEFTFNNWSDHYPYPIESHIDAKVLIGDSGDNIPGIPGIGPARATTILEKFGPTAFDLMDNVPLKGTAKYIQSINEFGDANILLNYQLMDLITFCEEAIKDYRSEIDEICDRYRQ